MQRARVWLAVGALAGAACGDDDSPGARDAATDGAWSTKTCPWNPETGDYDRDCTFDGTGDRDAHAAATCASRAEATCERDGQCHALRGWAPADYCAGDLTSKIYLACVPNNGCGAAITWASEPGTGRVLVFSCTRVPDGWTKSPSSTCPR